MLDNNRMRSGGQLLVDQLKCHGVDLVFCVPGESYLTALDAFHEAPEIRLITCRHEANAANMAEAYAKITGKPGICFVTRGPGACHAIVGLHTAQQDSSPLILFVGQVASHFRSREAFQEIDFSRLFDEVSKWSTEVIHAERIPELVSQAFHRATSGRPGPIVVALPEDVLDEETDTDNAARYNISQAHPGAADMQRLRSMLDKAKRPIVMLGGGTWTPKAVADIGAFIDKNGLATCTAFRNQDRIDNRNVNYVGGVGIGSNPDLIAELKDSDLLLVVGARVGEQTSQGYTLFNIPVPKQEIIHVHPDSQELGRVFRSALAINSGMPQFAAAARALEPVSSATWAGFRQRLRNSYENHSAIQSSAGSLDMGKVMSSLREKLPVDAILANDAGNFSIWVHRFLPCNRFPSQVGPTSGAMGYGLPAGIAAALAAPGRMAVCFAGDGGFLMSGSELATCAKYHLRLLIIVFNNGMYGTIRMHQARRFPGRFLGTQLLNPNFAEYARSFGINGETASTAEEFSTALETAIESKVATLIDLRMDPRLLTPTDMERALGEADGTDSGRQAQV